MENVLLLLLDNSSFKPFTKLLLLLKDNPSLNEVGAGAPLRPNVSKGNVSTTLVGGLLSLAVRPEQNHFWFSLFLLKRSVSTLLSYSWTFKSQN